MNSVKRRLLAKNWNNAWPNWNKESKHTTCPTCVEWRKTLDIVAKDRAVVGGFAELDGQEAEILVNDVLDGVPGFLQGANACQCYKPDPSSCDGEVRVARASNVNDQEPTLECEDEGEQFVGITESF